MNPSRGNSPATPATAGVFLSHSSADKPFVQKLAIDLLKRDIPVWFDKWELDTGDSLLRTIAKGIADSVRLVLVLSRHSIHSPWVEREIDLALAKERQTKGIVLIPIRIDDCTPPLIIADRIYASFRKPSDYYQSLDALLSTLVKSGAAGIVPPPERELIPFEIKSGLYLVKDALEQRLAKVLHRLSPDFSIGQQQLVFVDDVQIPALITYVRRLLTKESRASGTGYNATRHNALEELNRGLSRSEQFLRAGLAEILNGLRTLRFHPQSMAEACFWFVKEVRARTLHQILVTHGEHRLPVKPEIEWLAALDPAAPITEEGKQKFYEIENIAHVTAHIPSVAPTYSFVLDGDRAETQDVFRFAPSGYTILSVQLLEWTMVKFAIPSMIYQWLRDQPDPGAPSQSFNWNFDRYHVVPS